MAYRSTERTEQRRLERTTALVAAGVELVAETGFSAVTIARVAARAGVSTGAVYTYFPEKSALTAAIFDRAAGIELEVVRAAVAFGTAARYATPAQHRLDALVRVFGARAIRGKTLATALLFEAADVAVERERLVFRRAYTETVMEILADGAAEGVLPEQRIDVLAPAIVGALGEAVIRPVVPAEEPAPTLRAAVDTASDTAAVLDTLAAACQRLAGFPTPLTHPHDSQTHAQSGDTHR